jgi:nucleotide-binding universal stress UspA family protein
MLKHLLIPLDGTSMAEAVLPVAASLAEKAGARVTLLHVLERGAPATVHGAGHLRTARQAEEYLEQVASRSFPTTLRVTRHVHEREVADVAHSVVDHADEMRPDLVVMLAHGAGRWRDWISGNMAQQVVHLGVTPVLFLRQGADGQVAFPFHSILVPLDGRSAHEQGLPAAAALAQLCDAGLRLLTVVPTADVLSGTAAAVGSLLPESTRKQLDFAERDAAEYLGEHIRRLGTEGISATACVTRGDPAVLIAETAGKLAADLVVLGTHGRAGTQAFWEGSMAQRLLRKISASFLLAPAADSARAASA